MERRGRSDTCPRWHAPTADAAPVFLRADPFAVKRSAKTDRILRTLRLLQSSPAARRIVELRPVIESHLRARPRRVWPCATIAKLFRISPSLLRKWLDLGLLTRFTRPSQHHRPGLTEQSIRAFLRHLSERAEVSVLWVGRQLRRRPAEEKCLKALRELAAGEAPAPAEFAARAGVAVTTVHRLLAEGSLEAWRPTPHRPKICGWIEKNRRQHLTRKAPKKRQ